jgi:hypothetical protein
MSGIVIFSLAGVLGTLTLPGGEASRAQLTAHQGVVPMLRQLQLEGVSIGVEIPDRRFDVESVVALLEAAGLLGFVKPSLIGEAPFAGVPFDGPAVFVSRDRFRRAKAADAFRTVPDPSLVRAALRGEALFYLRATPEQAAKKFSWQPIVEGIELVPILVTSEKQKPVLYAVAGETAIDRLAERVSVEHLGSANLPEDTDMVLIQTSFGGEEGASFRKQLAPLPVVHETENGTLVALDATQPGGAFLPPDNVHGRLRALRASPTLIPTGREASPNSGSEGNPAAPSQEPRAQSQCSDDCDPDPEHAPSFAKLDGQLLEQNLLPWFGGEESDSACGASIQSRFLYHPDNEKAVDTLECMLQSILGDAHTHAFTLNETHHNVFGDLPGASDELVVVGAHLDATAARDGGCSLPTDVGCIAPGGDDDASGIAAVLAIATVFKQLADTHGPPARTIRFALFNAEEQGMIGSDAFAHDLAADGKQVRAMFQLDMIGTPGLGQPANTPGCAAPATPPWVIEIHFAGWEDLGTQIYDVWDAQKDMRKALEDSALLLSPGLAVRSFPVPNCDRDPAAGRSDQTSFDVRGFPACYVSEELWKEDCSGAMYPHPTYHRASDTSFDVDYAAAIARAVAGAAWLVAHP